MYKDACERLVSTTVVLLACVAGFLGFGKEGKHPLNVEFRPHDFPGKINQSKHRRKLKFLIFERLEDFWMSFERIFENKSCGVFSHTSEIFLADREQAVNPMHALSR